MATRTEIVAALNAVTPATTEVIVKIGNHYHLVNVNKVTKRKVFKQGDATFAHVGTADDVLTDVIVIDLN